MADMIPENAVESNAKDRPRDDVGDDFLAGMAEVRLAVDVINGGGDVKPFVHGQEQSGGPRRQRQLCAVAVFRRVATA